MSQLFTRRQVLKAAGVSAGLLVAACQPQIVVQTVEVGEAPTSAPAETGPITLSVMFLGDRPTPQHVEIWDELHPDIGIDMLNFDLTRHSAMWAAGAPPDLFMPNGVMLPGFLIRDMFLSLQPYVETSELIREDDLAPCHVLHRWNGRTTGSGDLYAVVKDWSTEFSLWVGTALFEEQGIPLPSDEEVLRYQDLPELAGAFVQKEGDRQLVWGLDSQFNGFAWTQTLMEMLSQAGGQLYEDDFYRMNLTQNDEAIAILEYWVNLMKADIMPNPLNPAPSWAADTIPNKQLAMQQFGYWFNGSMKGKMEEGSLAEDGVLYLTAPRWAGTGRRNPCAAGTCKVISSATKYRDQAWTFFEWETAKEPGIDGAKSGWGLPALKSQYEYMPVETAYDQQVQKVLQEDLQHADFVLQYNPFYDAQTANGSIWPDALEAHLLDEITFDEMLESIERQNNEIIKDGIDRLLT